MHARNHCLEAIDSGLYMRHDMGPRAGRLGHISARGHGLRISSQLIKHTTSLSAIG